MFEFDTVAAYLAALYADQTDIDVSERWTPTLEQLHEALVAALMNDQHEGADAIAAEIRRLLGEPVRHTTEGQLFGSKAGIWRLH